MTLHGVVGFVAGRIGSHPVVRDGASSGQSPPETSHRDGSLSVRERPGARAKGGVTDGPGKPVTPKAAKVILDQVLNTARIEHWLQLLGKMTPGDAVVIADMLAEEKRQGRDYPTANILFWENWAKVDPKGALACVSAHAGERGGDGLDHLMNGWACFDPAAATSAFLSLGDSPLTRPALAGLSRGLAVTDPAAAVDFATRLPDKLQQDAAGMISASIVQESGIEEAQAWFDSLPSTAPIFRKEAAHNLLESMARRGEPGAVESFAMERLDQSWESTPAEQSFAANMILQNGRSPWDYLGAAMSKYPNSGQPLALIDSISGLNP